MATTALLTLLQHQADPQLREDSKELPIIIAIARGATRCVKFLLDHRADPCATMSAPSPGPHGAKSSHTRHTTAMELAASSPAIGALLRAAIERANSTAEGPSQGNASSIPSISADEPSVMASNTHREPLIIRYPGRHIELVDSCCGPSSAQTTSRPNESA